MRDSLDGLGKTIYFLSLVCDFRSYSSCQMLVVEQSLSNGCMHERWVKCENYIVLSSIRIRVEDSHTSAIFLSIIFHVIILITLAPNVTLSLSGLAVRTHSIVVIIISMSLVVFFTASSYWHVGGEEESASQRDIMCDEH